MNLWIVAFSVLQKIDNQTLSDMKNMFYCFSLLLIFFFTSSLWASESSELVKKLLIGRILDFERNVDQDFIDDLILQYKVDESDLEVILKDIYFSESEKFESSSLNYKLLKEGVLESLSILNSTDFENLFTEIYRFQKNTDNFPISLKKDFHFYYLRATNDPLGRLLGEIESDLIGINERRVLPALINNYRFLLKNEIDRHKSDVAVDKVCYLLKYIENAELVEAIDLQLATVSDRYSNSESRAKMFQDTLTQE